jgi:hypothetical protein
MTQAGCGPLLGHHDHAFQHVVHCAGQRLHLAHPLGQHRDAAIGKHRLERAAAATTTSSAWTNRPRPAGARCSTSTSAARPDPQHRGHRQGRGQLRAGNADQGDRGARQGHRPSRPRPRLLNNPEAFNKFQQAQGELGGALSRLMVVSEQLPQPEGQPGLPGPARAAGRHREPHHRGAQPLHQDGAGLQRAGAQLPQQPDGHGVQLQVKPSFTVQNEAQIMCWTPPARWTPPSCRCWTPSWMRLRSPADRRLWS